MPPHTYKTDPEHFEVANKPLGIERDKERERVQRRVETNTLNFYEHASMLLLFLHDKFQKKLFFGAL